MRQFGNDRSIVPLKEVAPSIYQSRNIIIEFIRAFREIGGFERPLPLVNRFLAQLQNLNNLLYIKGYGYRDFIAEVL